MNGKEAYDKIFDKLTYDQQQELGDQVLRTVYQDLNRLEKLEKAIEILKNIFGIASVYSDKYNNHIERVLDCYDTFYIIPTQEEYELLKEVLGND